MKSLHVLVLDRDADRRKELVAMLRRGEHRVVAASDAAAAAAAIAAAEFDALLLDLALPELDLGALRRAIAPAEMAEPDSLEDAERRHLALVLRHTSGNKRKAAHLLGISRSTLLNKVRKYRLEVLAVLACSILLAPSMVLAQTGRPIPNGHLTSGTLSFDGHATAGDFVGKTATVSGQLTGAADVNGVRGWVEAPVATLKTGNGKRDKDLNKSMESDKFPVLRFELARVSRTGGTEDSLAVILHGTLAIHGVTRDVDVPGTVQLAGSTVRVHSDFPLNLKDYRIGGLSKMLGMLKMYENIEVHSDLVFQLGAAH
jgi:CheY-like chemotaxis protein/polyisoprenoid-binding protein YceI